VTPATAAQAAFPATAETIESVIEVIAATPAPPPTLKETTAILREGAALYRETVAADPASAAAGTPVAQAFKSLDALAREVRIFAADTSRYAGVAEQHRSSAEAHRRSLSEAVAASVIAPRLDALDQAGAIADARVRATWDRALADARAEASRDPRGWPVALDALKSQRERLTGLDSRLAARSVQAAEAAKADPAADVTSLVRAPFERLLGDPGAVTADAIDAADAEAGRTLAGVGAVLDVLRTVQAGPSDASGLAQAKRAVESATAPAALRQRALGAIDAAIRRARLDCEDPRAMLDAVRDAGSEPEAREAWLRATSCPRWPRTPEDVAELAAAAAALGARFAGDWPSGLRSAWLRAADDAARRIDRPAFDALVRGAEGTPALPADPPAWVRFNRESSELSRRAVASDSDAAAAATAFATAWSADPIVGHEAPAADWLRRLAEAARPRATLERSGPGSAGFAGESIDDGAGVVFRRQTPAGQIVMTFRRVDGGAPAYVLTDEVGVGVFAAVLDSAPDAATVLRSLDSRASPSTLRAWALHKSRIGPPREAAPLGGWWPGVPAFTLPAPPPPPGALSPMQAIPAAAAWQWAALVGCRLPTRAEWEAAARSQAGTPNLRDRAFATLWEGLSDVLRVQFAGACFDFGEAGAAPATTGADGVALFTNTSPESHAFLNLVGNVAEYVLEAEGPARADNVRIVGGSALSDPARPPSAPRAASSGVRGSFSDVGFRVAFRAEAPEPEGVLARRVSEILAGAPLLHAPQAP
jgi:hypothetical protein